MNGKQLIIVHIEDDDDHAELVSAAAAECSRSHRIIRFENAESGLKYLEGYDWSKKSNDRLWPDLILLDMSLGGMSGNEFLRRLKAGDQTAGIPVVVLAATEDDAAIRRAYRLGAASYIVKPSEFNEFVMKLAELNSYWSVTSEVPRCDKVVHG